MASQDKDAAMDGLLRRSLSDAARGGEAAKDCPTADLLAAYYERSLDATEMARHELHFSQCARCREQLAALVRADESVGTASKKASSGWSWLMHQWWLVPAAGTLALALIVYIGVWTRTRHVAAPASSEVAMSKQESPAPTEQRYSAKVPAPSGTPAEAPQPKKSRSAAATTKPGTNATRVENSSVERLKKSNADAIEPKAQKAAAQPAVAGPGESTALTAREAKDTSVATAPARTTVAHAATSRSTTSGGAKTTTAGGGRAFIARGVAGGVGARSGVTTTAGRKPTPAPAASGTAAAATPVNELADVQVPPQTQNRAVIVASEAPAVQSEANDKAQAAPGAPSPAPPAPAQMAVQETRQPETNQRERTQDLPVSRQEQGMQDQSTNRVLAQTEGQDEYAPSRNKPAAASKAGARTPQQSTAVTVTEAKSVESAAITTPDPQSLWRIAEGGFVEHSENGGTSWTGTQPVADAQWAAGSAPAARTCWLVGRDGAIVVTTDAVHWKIVTPPVRADFTEVSATNGRQATIIAADGRKFSTRDAGKSWQTLP